MKISRVVLTLPGVTIDSLDDIDSDSEHWYLGDGMLISFPVVGVKMGGYMAWLDEKMYYSSCSDYGLLIDITILQLEDWSQNVENTGVAPNVMNDGVASIMLCPGCGKPDIKWILLK